MQEDLSERSIAWEPYLSWEERELEEDGPLVRLGRALAEPMRVRILGLLASRSMYGQELAEKLHVTPPTISRHMALLKAAGLVRVQRQHTTHYYHLDGDGLQRVGRWLSIDYLSRLVNASNGQESPVSEPAQQERREIVLSVYFKDGRLMSIPASTSMQTEIRRTVLEKVAQDFKAGKIYTEAEVDTLLKAFNDDIVSLRRALLDERMLARDRGMYWLTHHVGGN